MANKLHQAELGIKRYVKEVGIEKFCRQAERGLLKPPISDYFETLCKEVKSQMYEMTGQYFS